MKPEAQAHQQIEVLLTVASPLSCEEVIVRLRAALQRDLTSLASRPHRKRTAPSDAAVTQALEAIASALRSLEHPEVRP